jgi:hypothetical protein
MPYVTLFVLVVQLAIARTTTRLTLRLDLRQPTYASRPKEITALTSPPSAGQVRINVIPEVLVSS